MHRAAPVADRRAVRRVQPTEAASPGEEAPPPLEQIEEGDGEGQYLLPVERNAKAVDLDLINNIMREPERERLSIILSDLGIGVAGRGRDLSEVIRRADPALKEIDEVLKILAEQNDALADLARDSDTVLAAGARAPPRGRRDRERGRGRGRRRPSGAATSRPTSSACPVFLRELKPTMVRLGALSDEMTPVLTDLGAVAPDINRMILELGPFSRAAIPAFESLGERRPIAAPRRSSRRARWSPTCGSWRARRGRSGRTPAACSSRSSAPTASSASWTTSSSRWPPSTASTRSATTCAPA